MRGDQCNFQHVQLADQGPNNPAIGLSTSTPLLRAANSNRVGLVKTPSLGLPDSLAGVSCRFFEQGACKNGDRCRFRHDTSSIEESTHEPILPQVKNDHFDPNSDEHKPHSPKAEPPNINESNARDLCGALVRFGPGGDVLNIEPATASIGRVQMCNVSCTWYQPSKTATLVFTSSQAMEEAAQKLGATKILDRTLKSRTAVNKKTTPWECFVKIGNLDVSTTSTMLKGACGQRIPRKVAFGENSYSSSAEEVSQAIQRLLSSAGTVDDWILSTSTKGAQNKATATFSTMEQATKAINELNGYKLPQLGGSSVLLSHLVWTKFSILSSMHEAISPELANLQQSLRSKHYLQIKSYPSTGEHHPFTTLHIVSDTAQELGRTKAAVEKILNGHTARGGKGIVWNELFLKPEGMTYLKDLGKQHKVFIYRNARKSILSLYGSEENKTIVESALVKAIDDLAVSTFKFDLDDDVPIALHQSGYRRIISKLGKTAARLNVMTSPKTITLQGSSQDADWAKAILREESGQALGAQAETEVNLTCAVCWCDITERYTTPCGHAYDRGCFVHQCHSAGDKDIPIRCLGALGSCQTVISFVELRTALSRDQLEELLQNSFTCYVRTHPGDYQYCPTADCDQVYEVSDVDKLFTCSTCLTSICTKCGAVSHEGLTCDQYKGTILGDEAFAEWKQKNDAKDCPKCGSTIQKSEGCNHMECRGCRAHICWVCLRVFDVSSEVYGHLKAEHGSFYDREYGEL